MAYKILNKDGDWLVQVQRGGKRRTKRGTGGEAAAKRAEALLVADLDQELRLEEAASLLGVKTTEDGKPARCPTLREYFETRWIEHAKVVQNPTTRRTQRTPFAYLLYYLGDKPLTQLLRPSEIHEFVEALKTNGPLTFAVRKDGRPVARKKDELKHATINKCLACLKALLKLAHTEDVIAEQPRIDLLPQDDSTLVVPPTDEELARLLAACEDFRRVAPMMPEVVEFASETGLRRGELFHLTWRSVELEHDAIRIETQAKSRVVNGQIWKPKHGKHRIVPLSAKAKAILEKRLANGPRPPDEPVFPNKGGCPYERMDGAGKDAGSGWFPAAVEAAGLKGKVTFHQLRHLFAVRLLTRGVPITVVSEMLGHSHIEITVKRYGRFASDARLKWNAVRVLDSILDVDASAPAGVPSGTDPQ